MADSPMTPEEGRERSLPPAPRHGGRSGGQTGAGRWSTAVSAATEAATEATAGGGGDSRRGHPKSLLKTPKVRGGARRHNVDRCPDAPPPTPFPDDGLSWRHSHHRRSGGGWSWGGGEIPSLSRGLRVPAAHWAGIAQTGQRGSTITGGDPNRRLGALAARPCANDGGTRGRSGRDFRQADEHTFPRRQVHQSTSTILPACRRRRRERRREEGAWGAGDGGPLRR